MRRQPTLNDEDSGSREGNDLWGDSGNDHLVGDDGVDNLFGANGTDYLAGSWWAGSPQRRR